MKATIVFISCGIFREELEYLVREKRLNWNIMFLDAALHVNFDKLEARLTEALEKNRKAGTKLKVLYGFCHPRMQEILDDYGAKKIQAGNCLEALAGEELIRKLDAEAKSFFLTAGWVNNWEAMFDLGEKDFNFDFSSMFGTYKRIIVFETGIIALDEEKIAAFSEFTKLPVERRKITLDHFLELVKSA